MVYLASDHQGFELKEQLKAFLASSDIDYEDLGPASYDKTDDYPDFAFTLGERVVSEPGSVGILACQSGGGMTIAVNKVTGIRGTLVISAEQAIKTKTDDNANVLVLASMNFGSEIFEVVSIWLETEFSGAERHVRRLQKIADYEQQ